MGRFYVSKWKRETRGFRAKISANWFVWDRTKILPVAGPFPKARAEQERLRIMTDTAKKKEDTSGEPNSPTTTGEPDSTDKRGSTPPNERSTETKKTETTERTSERTDAKD